MTDHRITEVTYGHLGEASYDLEEQNWIFSRHTGREFSIEPLHSPKECIPPPLSSPSSPSTRLPQTEYAQDKWLLNTLPETGPASGVLSSLRTSKMRNKDALKPSTLLAIGMASDIEHDSRSQKIQIMAMAYGDSGNVLRLVKPRVEALGWDGRRGTKLRSLSLVSSESGYWIGDGGPIQGIAFAADTNGLNSWLAVLKSEYTTILRPTYHQVNATSTSTIRLGKKYPPSRLNANLILTVKMESTGGRSHSDVSFNPWYVRQFAIIDKQGHWSVWNIEGQKRKRVTFEAIPGRSGYVQEDSLLDLGSGSTSGTDGWGRVLWAGSVSTLVVCDRHNIAVFDLKAAPKRLYSPRLFRPNSGEWILDVKRHSNNFQHIFVLTSKHMFWLQVTAAGEDHDELNGYIGARILLSVRHFRNDEDDTAKLALFEENDVCVALQYSTQSRLVSTYRFGMSPGGLAMPFISQGSFEIAAAGDGRVGTNQMFQTLCMLPTSFMLHNLNPISGAAKEYLNRNIRFYQLFGLDVDLRLSHVLCATKMVAFERPNSEPILHETVMAPTARRAKSSKTKSSERIIQDLFVVPDGLEESDDDIDVLNLVPTGLGRLRSFDQGEIRSGSSMSINARPLFETSYLRGETGQPVRSALPPPSRTVVDYFQNLQRGFQTLRGNGQEGLNIFSSLTGYTSFFEDIDEATSILKEFSTFIGQEDDYVTSMAVKLYVMRPLPFTEFENGSKLHRTMPDLSSVYDKIVDLWVSCLPKQTPGPARLAKERIIRNIAMELHLSSLALLTCNKLVSVPKLATPQPEVGFVLPVRGKPSSLGLGESQGRQRLFVESSSSFSTSAAPQTLTHNERSISFVPAEDSAIARLRGYAISIKSQPPLGDAKSAILAHWPSSPGVDPSKYSWEAARAIATDNEGLDTDEEELMKRAKEKARRQRRSEKFLKRQRADTIGTASQPTPTISLGSQPVTIQHFLSSQSNDVAMTQPDRGVFGSRPRTKGFKKRRVGGF